MSPGSEQDARIGLVLHGRYRITQRLGEGGMGVVYRGERLELDRPVAIKFLHSPYAKSPKFVTRFQREARAMSKLSHPCCVSVIDFGVEDVPYIVMDFVTGKTLREVLDAGRPPPQRAVQIARLILSGLAHAHGQGIVHRDIKPGNIMLGEATGIGDHVRIFDFGLAKIYDSDRAGDASVVGIVGTPCYMAPEQARADKVDARADLYATGIVLFELLTGQKPFDAPETVMVLRMHNEKPPPKVRELAPEVSSELEAVVAKALEKDPNERFQSATEFLEALDRVPESRGMRSQGDKSHDTVAFAQTQQVESPRVSSSPGERPTVPAITQGRSELRVGVIAAGLIAVLGGATALWLLTRPSAPTADGRTDAAHAASAGAGEPEATVAAGALPAEDTPAPAEPAEPLPADEDSEDLAAPAVEPEPVAQAPEAVPPTAQAPDAATPVADMAFDLSEAALAEADEALNTTSESEANISDAEGAAVRTMADVEALITANELDAAIAGVRRMRRDDPRNAELPLMLGNLYFRKGWWSDGLAKYREAIRMRSALKLRPQLQRNAIDALAGDKTYPKARALIVKDIGRSAMPRLRAASRNDSSRAVRERAKSIMRQLSR